MAHRLNNPFGAIRIPVVDIKDRRGRPASHAVDPLAECDLAPSLRSPLIVTRAARYVDNRFSRYIESDGKAYHVD